MDIFSDDRSLGDNRMLGGAATQRPACLPRDVPPRLVPRGSTTLPQPQVHRPLRVETQPQPQTLITPSPIRLDTVRPKRTQNEYVDSPQKGSPPVKHISNNNSLINGENWTLQNEGQTTISQQPTSTGLKNLKDTTSINNTVEDDHQGSSIICQRCGKCKCRACTEPRDLPSYWIWDKKVECSANKLVEYCSCLCCVECIFYHCFKDVDGEDDNSSGDDPCACCERPHCCKRWTVMGLLSVCLPCLLLYWPLSLGVKSCTACYNKCTRRGCHCRRDKIPSANKRLLFDSESSSA